MEVAPVLNGKIILVVTQDGSARLSLGTLFKQAHVQETQFLSEVRAAKDWLLSNTADLVIVDADLPDDVGALWAQELASETRTPVLAIGSLDAIVKLQERQDFLVRLVAKPFRLDDLEEAAGAEMGTAPAAQQGESLEDGFCKVNLSDFLAGKEVKFDLYIRLSRTKFVKIAHKGENPSLDRLRSYKDRNVRFLYIPKQDFRTYVGFNLAVIPALTKSDKVGQQKKVALIKHVGEILLEKSFVDGVGSELLAESKTYVETATSVLADSSDAFRVLQALESHSDHVFAHSVAVSLYSVMIGRQLGWSSPGTLFKLATGGLFHDIGKKEIPREVLAKQRNDLSPEEVKLYESHSLRGSQILSRIVSIPPDIVQIVMQHHENALGQGFPQGLRRENTHPLARVIAVANEFVHFVLPLPGDTLVKPKDAIDRLLMGYDRLLDPFFFIALMQIFNYEVPHRMKVLYDRERVKTSWGNGSAA